MAVIRTKKNTFGFSRSLGGVSVKSGNTSKSVHQILNDEEKAFSFFYDEDLYSKDGMLQGDNDFLAFDDDNIIIFENKSVIPEYGIELKYFDVAVETLSNKLEFTPNRLATNYQTILAPAKREVYNKTLVPNYLEENSNENITFKETPMSEIIAGNKNTLVFNFDLDTSCKLSFNKTSSNHSIITFQTSSGNKTFKKHNGNTVYLYGTSPEKYGFNQDKGWRSFDYLGNIASTYYDNIDSFLSAPIAFNSPSPLIVSNTLSLPIDTFFFPFASKFKAEKRHFIDIDKYIKKSFVIEKINIRAKVSNYSVNKTNGQPALNFLNFFIMNQRGDLSTNQYESGREISYATTLYSSSSSVLQAITVSPDLSGQPVYTSSMASDSGATIDTASSLSSQEFVIDGSNNTEDVFENEGRSQLSGVRELITYANLANFSVNSSIRDSFDNIAQSLEQNSDLFIDNSNIDIVNQANFSECIYENRIVEMEVTPRIANSNTSLPHMSNFGIFPEKKDNSSNSLSFRSNKFFGSAEVKGNPGSFITDPLAPQLAGRPVGLNENEYVETQYVIEPGDKIIVGVSLSPDYNIDVSGANLRGQDVLELLDNIEIGFTGYYLEDDKIKYYNTQRQNFKRNKRFGDVYNKVTDGFGSPNKTIQKGVYVDNFPNLALAGSAIQNSPSQRYTLNSSIIKLPNDYTSQINNNVSKVSNNYFIYNDSDKRYPFHYFDLRNFGQFSNFIKYFKNAPYFNSETNKIEYALNKNLKRGFFINKSPCKTSGSLNFDFSSIQNYNNASSNWLKDNMFFDFTPTEQRISVQLVQISPGIFMPIPSGFYQYSQNTIEVMMFDIEDNIGNKVHFLVRLTPPESIFGDDFDNNYFISSGGFFNSYDSTSRLLRSYSNTSENHVYAIIDIPEDITSSFDTNQSGSFISIPKTDEFVIKIVEGINKAYQGVYLGCDLDIVNKINSGISFTRLILDDELEGFYNDQSITLEDIESSSITFRFKVGADVYSESDDLVYSGNDPSSGVIEVGIRSPSTGQKDSKRNQIISLLNAINKSSLKIRATQSYDSDIELFISQTSAGSLGDTNVVNNYNSTLSYELGDFDNGSSLKSHSFNLAVNASLKEVEDINIMTINIENLTRGKTGNNNINSGTASNVTKENFSVTEGDVINSYNIDDNARYDIDYIAFKES